MNVGPGITAEFPVLTDEQVASVGRRGTRHHTTAGEVLYAAGDRGYDFIVIEAGEVDVLRPAMPNAPEALIATWGPGRFLGELNLLTGQSAIATARVRAPGVVHRIAPAQFRELQAADAEVSDLVLRVLLARRQALRQGEPARTLEILGSQQACTRSCSTASRWVVRPPPAHGSRTTWGSLPGSPASS
jgi:thioredoxin reductase (NADPH)